MRIKLLILNLFLGFILNAQEGTDSYQKELHLKNEIDKKKRNILLISEVSLYTLSLVGLNELWYADYERTKFHFINDNQEWMQMDKLGHVTASYYSGVVGIKAYKWTGMNKKDAIWYGGLTGTFFLAIVEFLDGQSAEWGASSGDLIANSLGSFLAISQELKWDEQRIQLKYSYNPSVWAEKNPQQLGENYVQQALKDYNAQTYWVSFNIRSLFSINKAPEWLSLALGHSANRMITPYYKPGDNRERQFLLSLDVDLNKIQTSNKKLNNILHVFGFLKFPMPTLEWRENNFYFHSIYY